MIALLLFASADAAPRYTIAVEPVGEVCLAGTADPAWARGVLAPEGLAPALSEGRASLSVCATSARFGGRDFREATIGLAVAGTAEGAGEALYLVRALNSIRFYAWVERARNKSPYAHGTVEVSVGAEGARFAMGTGRAAPIAAQTPSPASAPAPRRYEGPIHQPGGTFFHARLEGETTTVPFGPTDTWTLPARGADPVADLLVDAGFVPTTWHLRPAGRHAKGETLRR